MAATQAGPPTPPGQPGRPGAEVSNAAFFAHVRRRSRRLGGAEPAGDDKGGSNQVRGWLDRASVPESTRRTALVQLVQEWVPDAPPGVGEWSDFAALVEFLVAVRARAQRKGAAAGTATRVARGAAGRALGLAKVLLGDPEARCAGLDLAEWGLGSWLVDGAVPPYVPRDIDDALWAALGDPGRGLVVLTGPPKAGKTRTLAHALQRHTATAGDPTNPADQGLRCWRVRPQLGALPAIAQALEADPALAADVVVVLDDLQQHSFGASDGVTDRTLGRVLATGVKVVATLHDSALARMQEQLLDHRTPVMPTLAGNQITEFAGLGLDLGTGASPALVALLEHAALPVPATLVPNELDGVDADLVAAAAAHNIDTGTFTRLPEVMAALDQLLARARAAQAGTTPARAALLSAAVDATYLYPAGATEEQLSQLHHWAHRSAAPTKRWTPTVFQAALEWTTDPIGGPGSPHAILQPADLSTDTTGYKLFDALLPRLNPDPWTPTHLIDHAPDLPPDICFYAGLAAFDMGDLDGARHWWQQAAATGHADAMFNLGVLAQEAGDLDGARHWWQQAAATGHADAMNNMGVLAQEAGDLDGARHWYQQAAEAGHADAMFNLGVLAQEAGDLDGARDWWQQAAEAGHAGAVFNLGVLAHQAGDLDGPGTGTSRPPRLGTPSR